MHWKSSRRSSNSPESTAKERKGAPENCGLPVSPGRGRWQPGPPQGSGPLLKEYPASREETAIATYGLAKSYEGLKFYYEARQEYERLAGEFPESANGAEALFKAGEMSYRVRQYSDAAERLRTYVDKYRAGDHVKDSFFIIADCYSQLQRNDFECLVPGDTQALARVGKNPAGRAVQARLSLLSQRQMPRRHRDIHADAELATRIRPVS
jgi:TolA-binding protein